MPRRIEEDHKDFHDVYSGRIRKSLKKFINDGHIFRTHPNGERIPVPIPRIDIPHIVHGGRDEGVGRGEGKDGDMIQKGNNKGKGKGKKAGNESGEFVEISLEMEEVLKFMQNELKLPDLKPKPNETLQDEEIKYTSISKTGPEALRHNRRTMLQALKRQAAQGTAQELHKVPGFAVPVRQIFPINSDKRYRQYRIIKKPSSNAVIFFARDGSGSMDETKCQIVSDMCWWLDIWIRRFYERVERCYIWHDTDAREVDEQKFYRMREGGGTICSSALKLINSQFESRFPPNKWNFYIFYFTDGDNWGNDNEVFLGYIKDKFPPEVVNFVGVTQILSYGDGLKGYLQKYIGNTPNLKLAEITSSGEDAGNQIRQAIVDLIGNGQQAQANPVEAVSE